VMSPSLVHGLLGSQPRAQRSYPAARRL